MIIKIATKLYLLNACYISDTVSSASPRSQLGCEPWQYEPRADPPNHPAMVLGPEVQRRQQADEVMWVWCRQGGFGGKKKGGFGDHLGMDNEEWEQRGSLPNFRFEGRMGGGTITELQGMQSITVINTVMSSSVSSFSQPLYNF